MKNQSITQEKIEKDFSYMFKADKNSPMGWFGIECGRGWNDLIYEMCSEIKKADKRKNIKFAQIKEKFGLLRVYIDSSTSKIYPVIIEKYERKSATICEKCGEKGKTRNVNGWLTTLCNQCYQKE
jgi:hypothetical protein